MENTDEKWYDDAAVRFLIGVLIGGAIGIAAAVYCTTNPVNLMAITDNDEAVVSETPIHDESSETIDFSDKLPDEQDLSGWNTSRVINMSAIFADYAEVDEASLDGFDISCVKELCELFDPVLPEEIEYIYTRPGR